MKVAFIVPYEGKKLYQQNYDQILAAIETNGWLVISPEKPQQYHQALTNDKPLRNPARAHYEFIRKSIIDSDAVIVEASYEDFRVGHETTLALIYRKPVLVMAQHLNFKQFIHHPDFTSAKYKPAEVPQMVKGFLETVTTHQQKNTQTHLQKSVRHLSRNASRPKTIAVFGGIYADIFNKVEYIPRENEVALSNNFKISLGGKATNAAVAMARLDNKVIMLGQLGHDSVATDIEATLVHEGINTSFISRNSTHSTGTVVLAVNQAAQYSTIVHEAANIQITFAQIDQFFNKIDRHRIKLDCLYVTLEAQPTAVNYVIREAANRGIYIFCDAAPHARPLDARLLPLVDIVAPNQIEAKAMTGVTVIDQSTASQAAAALEQAGARQVLITMGNQGAYWQSGADRYFIPALTTTPIDEAGAGDAFRAAFITKLLTSKSIIKALELGTLAGAYAVTRFGSYDSMPTPNELAFFKTN